MRNPRKYLAPFVLTLILMFIGTFSGLARAEISDQTEVEAGKDIVGIVIEELMYNNIKEVDIKDLMRGAIRGMINEINDPDAYLLTPEGYGEMLKKGQSEEGKPTVSWRDLGDDIGHIQISFFCDTTSEELKKALQDLKKGNIILDLRNSSGGSAVAAAEVAEDFLDIRGRVIFSLRRRPGEDTIYAASREGTFKGHLVVIVNAKTASVAELLAGSLQDYRRGLIVGVKTSCRGSMQRVIPLPNGGAFGHTIFHCFTPAGKDIHGNGITPDVIIENPATGEDLQLQKAIDVLKQKPVG